MTRRRHRKTLAGAPVPVDQVDRIMARQMATLSRRRAESAPKPVPVFTAEDARRRAEAIRKRQRKAEKMHIVKPDGSLEADAVVAGMEPWKKAILDEAIKYAQTVVFGFDQLLMTGNKLLPVDCPENRMTQLMISIECLIGGAVAGIVKWAHAEEPMEQKIRDLVSQKFEHLRKPVIHAPGGMVDVPS